MEKYGQPDPPAYNLTEINVPVALYHAQNDWLSSTEVTLLIVKLLNALCKKYIILSSLLSSAGRGRSRPEIVERGREENHAFSGIQSFGFLVGERH